MLIPSSGRKVALMTLLDLGCTHCLISPTLVGKLGTHLRWIKQPITFCQLDRSIAGGVLATFATEPLELAMESHSQTITLIVAPDMEWPLVLGLTWL